MYVLDLLLSPLGFFVLFMVSLARRKKKAKENMLKSNLRKDDYAYEPNKYADTKVEYNGAKYDPVTEEEGRGEGRSDVDFLGNFLNDAFGKDKNNEILDELKKGKTYLDDLVNKSSSKNSSKIKSNDLAEKAESKYRDNLEAKRNFVHDATYDHNSNHDTKKVAESMEKNIQKSRSVRTNSSGEDRRTKNSTDVYENTKNSNGSNGKSEFLKKISQRIETSSRGKYSKTSRVIKDTSFEKIEDEFDRANPYYMLNDDLTYNPYK